MSPAGTRETCAVVLARACLACHPVSTSKRPEEIGVVFDFVVTVCDSAHESCPIFPATTRIVHVGFDDPPRLAKGAASDDEAMPHYRRVRDEIRAFIETLPGALAPHSTPTTGARP